jgi:hypothetical protein
VTSDPLTEADLLRWSHSLAAIARTGLGFTESLYERERFEEILHVAADIHAAATRRHTPGDVVNEWLRAVGSGVAGYVTPKVAVGAVVGNEAGEILLIQRADSGVWLYPTGWADVGYSPAEVAVKEVEEETGITVEVDALIGGVSTGCGADSAGHRCIRWSSRAAPSAAICAPTPWNAPMSGGSRAIDCLRRWRVSNCGATWRLPRFRATESTRRSIGRARRCGGQRSEGA